MSLQKPAISLTVVKGSIAKDVEETFRKKAMEKYGYTKGSLSKALEEAIKLWLQVEAKRSGEEKTNNEAYAKLKDEINTKYAGKYVSIENGKIVAVGNTLEEVYEEVEKMKSDISHRLIFKAGEEIPKKVRLGWRVLRKPVGLTSD